MRFGVLALFVVLTGCDASQDEPQPEPKSPAPLTTTQADADAWQRNAERIRPDFLRSATRIHQALEDESTVETAVDVCEALTRYEDDARLVSDVRRAAKAHNRDADLNFRQAASFARLVNERVCPDIAP